MKYIEKISTKIKEVFIKSSNSHFTFPSHIMSRFSYGDKVNFGMLKFLRKDSYKQLTGFNIRPC